MSEIDCQVALLLTTCFHKKMIGLVLRGILVAGNCLKTMTTDKLYQRIDCCYMLIHIQSLIWPATRPHYLLDFGSEKIGPRLIKLAFIVYIIHIHTDPAPRGGGHTRAVPLQMTACAPPNKNCDPTSEDCAPKKLTCSGLLECKSRPKLVFAQ